MPFNGMGAFSQWGARQQHDSSLANQAMKRRQAEEQMAASQALRANADLERQRLELQNTGLGFANQGAEAGLGSIQAKSTQDGLKAQAATQYGANRMVRDKEREAQGKQMDNMGKQAKALAAAAPQIGSMSPIQQASAIPNILDSMGVSPNVKQAVMAAPAHKRGGMLADIAQQGLSAQQGGQKSVDNNRSANDRQGARIAEGGRNMRHENELAQRNKSQTSQQKHQDKMAREKAKRDIINDLKKITKKAGFAKEIAMIQAAAKMAGTKKFAKTWEAAANAVYAKLQDGKLSPEQRKGFEKQFNDLSNIIYAELQAKTGVRSDEEGNTVVLGSAQNERVLNNVTGEAMSPAKPPVMAKSAAELTAQIQAQHPNATPEQIAAAIAKRGLK